MDKWRQIWKKRKIQADIAALETLIRVDGFDTGSGKITEKEWLRYVKFIFGKMGISKRDSIFEIGCGSGAFLYPLYKMGHRVGGIDYSGSLIRMANKKMDAMDFSVCEARHLQTREKYDIVIANSVFHYFPDLEYARDVVNRMIEKSVKATAFLDLPDSDFEIESEREREANHDVSEGEYKMKYVGLSHLYFKRKWFSDLLEKYNFRVDIFDQNIKQYGNSKFRFNVLVKK